MDSPREQLRKQLREKAPDMAKFVDKMRETFGDVKITYLKIDDVEYGKPSLREKVHPCNFRSPKEELKEWYDQVQQMQRTRSRRSR